MASIDRPLSGTALHFHLGEGHLQEHIDESLLERAGRSGRTLVKDGPLRVTLVALAPGGSLAAHSAAGPIAVQVLSGEVRLTIGADEWVMSAGEMLAIAADVEHSVASVSGGSFLLTVVNG